MLTLDHTGFTLLPLLSSPLPPLPLRVRSMYTRMHMHSVFCLNYLRVSCRHDAPLPLNTLVSISENKDILLGINTINNGYINPSV